MSAVSQTSDVKQSQEGLYTNYKSVRASSVALCANLETEDFGLQAMPEVSPPKWHLAHTSWFFETFILKPFTGSYRAFDDNFEYLFNSYYNGIGEQYPRAQRGLLSRPGVEQVLSYRDYIDQAMLKLLSESEHPQIEVIRQRCELGLHHEQQHQELLCTDIKYSFSFNPLYPAAMAPTGTRDESDTDSALALDFVEFEASDCAMGFSDDGFHFDNEVPEHRVHVPAFALANRLITNEEYLEFISCGGYKRAEFWLADGWLWRQSVDASRPLYWVQQENIWYEYTLYGLKPLALSAPVSHINYFEADAFARWAEKRLPREQEWELACRRMQIQPAFEADTGSRHFHPQPVSDSNRLMQMFGSLWQWTQSGYNAYPGYRPAAGAIGEYNGKFMSNQYVLRGSSCVTPTGHSRVSYRNFFYAKDQWQFSGIRLAKDL